MICLLCSCSLSSYSKLCANIYSFKCWKNNPCIKHLELCLSMKCAIISYTSIISTTEKTIVKKLHWTCCAVAEHICPRRHMPSWLSTMANHERNLKAYSMPEVQLPVHFAPKTIGTAGFVDFQSKS